MEIPLGFGAGQMQYFALAALVAMLAFTVQVAGAQINPATLFKDNGDGTVVLKHIAFHSPGC